MTEPTKLILSDGVERGLKYTLASFREIKRKTGKSLLREGANFLAELDEEMLVVLLHAGLVEKSITEDELAELVTPSILPSVMESFIAAITESMPKNETPEPENIEPEPETVMTMEGPKTIQ